MVILTLFLIPLLVAIGFYKFGNKKVTIREFGLMVVAVALVAALNWAILYKMAVGDTEFLNGSVIEKSRITSSCEHSYSCRCNMVCSGTGKSVHCANVCDTCYEHMFDYDWMVRADVGRVYIPRVNRQGTVEPPRYTSVKIGDPFAVTHSYDNYIKGSPGTLFRRAGLVEKFKKSLPDYPEGVYDFYKRKSVVNLGAIDDSTASALDQQILLANRVLGPLKQVNVILVATKNQPTDYLYALEQHWMGGKKNDFIAVLNVDNDGIITWANAIGWSKDTMAKIKIRDDLQGKKIDSSSINLVLDHTKNYYQRKSMKDFSYLKASIIPTTTQFVVSLIVSILITVGLGVYFYKNDIA